MVDYDLRALEQYVLEFSDDEDMEELLILKYGERKNLLAEAAAPRRLTEFDLDSISPVNFKDTLNFVSRKLTFAVYVLLWEFLTKYELLIERDGVV